MATQAIHADAAAAAPFSMRAILAPLIAIIVGAFMVALDGTATNVAIPSLVKTFHDPLSTTQWVVTGYTLAQAAVIPLAGWLSDRYGSKTLFLTSVVLFTIGSVLCATAPTSGTLILFRVLQGLGGGFVLPVGFAYVYRLAPPTRVGAVIGMLGIPILLAPAIGPVLAGWLVQSASWRWIFLINLPVGVIGLLLGLRTLPKQLAPLWILWIFLGIILGPLAFAALVYGISEGSTSWTSANTLVGIIVGLLALVAFIVVELRAPQPLLELRVFRSIDFDIAIVAQWIGIFALYGALFLIPLFLQQVRGYGAFDTGLTLLPQALMTMVFMPISGALFDRIGARPLVAVGAAIMAVAGFILATVSITTRGWDLILPLGLYGAGMGMMLMSLNTQVLNAAPRALVGRVSALMSALQQVVGSIAVAGLSTILTSRITTHTTAAKVTLAAHTPHTPVTSLPRDVQARMAAEAQRLLGSAAAAGFDDTFRVAALITVLAAVAGLLLRQLAPSAQDAEQVVGQPAPMHM